MLKRSWTYAIALACAAALACSSGRAPAEAALKLAEEAVNGARAEGEKLVPDDFRSLSDDLTAAKDAMAKGDYKTALASAQAVQQKANDVMAKAKAKKDELTKSWTEMSESVPKTLAAIQGQVDNLSKVKKLPKGLDAGKLAAAKEGLASATADWNAAQESAKAGDLTGALAKATAVKNKAGEITAILGGATGTAAPAGAPAK